MLEKVETPNSKLQKVTLLVAMQTYEADESDLDAGEWLLNVLMNCANPHKPYSHYGAEAYFKAAQVLSVQNCDVVVSNGI
tara:strand:- start:54 stop:293 length:240 start_codon:yes stop_codon:yes gene_type:complete